MTHNPVLVQALVEARVDELRRTGEASVRSRRQARRHPVIGVVRHRTGWLLVGLGLRMVLPGSAVNRPVAGGHR